ncbi:tumor necrosis factor receptor superfamily member 6 [Orycteropus afer afer]|uniref:Tumor necrosis factor receptor superfamily member 6 n=1 Tax=Orycteropus afer afer TaxID=1230840 RepID=A0AC54ZB52_ORYAF|nr:tumor necrosis factor receptor superfamily member 6 [Orycteropus afer afer]
MLDSKACLDVGKSSLNASIQGAKVDNQIPPSSVIRTTVACGLKGIQALILILIAGSVNAQVTAVNHEGLKLRKNVIKREIGCREGLHPADQSHENHLCCQPCPAGKRKIADCKVHEGKPDCILCKEGEDYTEKENYLDKCIKCDLCDGGHGLEVEKNCTRNQNVKCRCKADFFCKNSSCDYCEPCMTCEHGTIEKCTSTSNTKCKEKENSYTLLWLLVTPVVIGIPGIIYGKWVYRKHKRGTYGNPESTEMRPLNFTDVDLSNYITYIAEEMTINQVKDFVRKNGIHEAKMDEIKNNYSHDTAEQKVQLLRNWYQLHGKKDACNTLINNLRKANLYAVAEKIQEILKKDIASDNENTNFNNENESQSLT